MTSGPVGQNFVSYLTRYEAIKRWIKIAVTLLVAQLITYFTIADRQLKGKLLDDDWLSSIRYSTDSILVRDFYVTDCGVRGRSISQEWRLFAEQSIQLSFKRFTSSGMVQLLFSPRRSLLYTADPHPLES